MTRDPYLDPGTPAGRAMLMRLWRLLVPRAEPRPDRRREPVMDAVVRGPAGTTRRVDPRSTAACDHDPPLTRRLSLVDAEAGVFDGERQPGDEIWRFCSPAEAWRAKGGRAGVALVRNGEVVRSVITMLN